jgi:hypothetical protein
MIYVVGGGGVLKIWREAANVLNKKLQAVKKGFFTQVVGLALGWEPVIIISTCLLQIHKKRSQN